MTKEIIIDSGFLSDDELMWMQLIISVDPRGTIPDRIFKRTIEIQPNKKRIKKIIVIVEY